MLSDVEVLFEFFEIDVSDDDSELSLPSNPGMSESVFECAGDLVLFAIFLSVVGFVILGKSSTILDDDSDMSSIMFLF